MRVLLGHNFYRSSAPSGEDAVYRNEKALLEDAVSVVPYEKFNDDLVAQSVGKQLATGLKGTWSSDSYKEVSRVIVKEKPDIAHFHNTFPQISPSAWAACRNAGVPVIQTIHNYRYICPNALLLRDTKPCEKCVHGSLANAVLNRCYRDSFSASLAQSLMILRNRLNGGFQNNVNCYVCLTQFARSKMIEGGLPESKVDVVPNFLPEAPVYECKPGRYVVYSGRLSEEKGVGTLLKAWAAIRPRFELHVFGDGPVRGELERFARDRRLSVKFWGYQDRALVLQYVREALFQVVPSQWYEGFPMVILEALGSGTPMLVSRIGSLAEVVSEGETGWGFKAGDPDDLAKVLRIALSQAGSRPEMRQHCKDEFSKKFTKDVALQARLSLYEKIVSSPVS